MYIFIIYIPHPYGSPVTPRPVRDFLEINGASSSGGTKVKNRASVCSNQNRLYIGKQFFHFFQKFRHFFLASVPMGIKVKKIQYKILDINPTGD